MTTLDLVVKGRRVLGDDGLRPRSVGVRQGVIAVVDEMGANLPGEQTFVLGDDEVLIPGLVDTHVHVNEPGRTEWEGFTTATRGAAAGGVTTILDMPLNSVPPTIDVPSLLVKQQAAKGQCHVDVGFWGGAVPSSLGGLEALHEAGVWGFKCFLIDSGTPDFPPLDGGQLHAAMAEVAGFDGLLVVHAEDAATMATFSQRPGPRYLDFLHSRPPETELVAVERVIAAARRTGARAHIVHLSSAASVPALRKARADGVRVTVETCPHYLALSAEEVPDGQTQFKCCPPIRDNANRELLWEALDEGVIDIIVTDHSPTLPELKMFDSGDFLAAWGGVSSLQLGLSVVWTEARGRGHGLEDVVGWMSAGTADLVGLGRKGRIAADYDADLVVFAPEETFVVDADALEHRHPVTPYAGRRLAGVVRRTFLRGTPVTGSQPRGSLLHRREGT